MVSLSKKISVFSDGSALVSSPNSRGGNYCIVKNDYDQRWGEEFAPNDYHVSRNTRNRKSYFEDSGTAVPATATFLNDINVDFTCVLQNWLHEVCCKNAGMLPTSQEAKTSFLAMYRDNAWITNYAGTWTREDCINGKNIGAGYPQLQPMATGGALLRINGEIRKFGEDAYLVDAINPLHDYSLYSPEAYPWLFYRPTQSKRVWYNKAGVKLENVPDDGDKIPYRKEEYYQEPLWFYAEKALMAVFGFLQNPLSSTGWSAAIQKWRVRVLSPFEKVPNPFIMADGRILQNPYQDF